MAAHTPRRCADHQHRSCARWVCRTHTLQRHPLMQGVQDRPGLLLPNCLPLLGAQFFDFVVPEEPWESA